MIVSRNAIYSERFASEALQVQRQPFRFIYTSDAFRGLGHLLNMIPRVKDKYPLTELYIYTREEHLTDEWRAIIDSLPYVHLHPRLRQEELSVELMKSDVWLYPTDFEETYCIAALEAMAAGCLVATTRLAGLTTTVADRGVMVDPPIIDENQQLSLLTRLFFVLDRPEVKSRYVQKAREWALSQTYSKLAKEWVRMFRS